MEERNDSPNMYYRLDDDASLLWMCKYLRGLRELGWKVSYEQMEDEATHEVICSFRAQPLSGSGPNVRVLDSDSDNGSLVSAYALYSYIFFEHEALENSTEDEMFCVDPQVSYKACLFVDNTKHETHVVVQPKDVHLVEVTDFPTDGWEEVVPELTQEEQDYCEGLLDRDFLYQFMVPNKEAKEV